MKRTEKSIRLERVWRDMALESGVPIPRRTAFKARQFPDLLPDLTVGKVTDTGVEVMMAGSNVIGRFSDEITGQDYMQFIDEPQRPFLGQPVVADWSDPIDWIDLGAGVPEVGDTTSVSR